jgi:hypothetical protein
MKRLILATAVALAVTGCATNQDAYYAAIAAREARQAEQELRADTAIAQMAASGDAQSKGMGLMYFALKASGGVKAPQQAIAAPKSVADSFLPWASLIVPSITQFYSIAKNAEIAINSSNNSLAGKMDDNDMVTNLVIGREPIVGTTDDVLLYPFPPVAP